jgi:hypothetical protein
MRTQPWETGLPRVFTANSGVTLGDDTDLRPIGLRRWLAARRDGPPVSCGKFQARDFGARALPAYLLPGSSLEVDHERYRYNVEEIRQLYDSEKYPLKRRAGL